MNKVKLELYTEVEPRYSRGTNNRMLFTGIFRVKYLFILLLNNFIK